MIDGSYNPIICNVMEGSESTKKDTRGAPIGNLGDRVRTEWGAEE